MKLPFFVDVDVVVVVVVAPAAAVAVVLKDGDPIGLVVDPTSVAPEDSVRSVNADPTILEEGFEFLKREPVVSPPHDKNVVSNSGSGGELNVVVDD